MKLEDFTFKARLMKKLKIIFLSDKEFQRIKNVLLTDGKEIFFSYLKKRQENEKDNWSYKAYMENYDERINTLPKESLYDLYLSYEEIGHSNDKDFATLFFCNLAENIYSLDRWSGKKLVKIMTQKRIK